MKNVISYVLFSENTRYWPMVPFILSANSIVYPDFTTRVYVHGSAKNTPGVRLLEEVARTVPSVEIRMTGEWLPWEDKKLTVFRTQPLWDQEVGKFLVRDLDASPSSLEAKAVRLWMKTDSMFCGIRGYLFHSIPLMGGLCGFDAMKIRPHLKHDFAGFLKEGDKYVGAGKAWDYDSDQWFISTYFRYLLKNGLDFPMLTANPMEGYQGRVVKQEEYAGINLGVPQDAMTLIDRLVKFPGCGLVIENRDLHELLSTGHGITKLISSIIAKEDYGARWRM